MTKILFTNTNCSWNKGSAAQVISTSELLKKLLPNAEFTLLSHYPSSDEKYCKKFGIKLVSSWWWRLSERRVIPAIQYRMIFPLINTLVAFVLNLGLSPSYFKSKLLMEYLSADAVIDLSGDSFSDSRGGFSPSICSTFLLGFSLKKPIILYSQSVGPFKRLFSPLARYCLNRVNIIIVREQITKEYLENFGVKKPVYLTADCAFLLDPVPSSEVESILIHENINVKRPLIGISANCMLDDKNNNYVESMVKLVDYMISKWGAQVLFIPHVVSANWKDDRQMGEKIYRLVKNKENAHLITGDYSPNQLKGIISICDIFIGGRMHANIAALSSYVPTIATAWSHKYYGIMRVVGQEMYVCDFRTMSFDKLKLKIDELWDNKVKIRNDLYLSISLQKTLALESGKNVFKFIQYQGR